MFSFLLSTKILFGDHKINPEEWRFFLTGTSGEIKIISNPTNWLDDKAWTVFYRELVGMSKLKCFEGFIEYVLKNDKEFKKIYDSPQAHEQKLPGGKTLNITFSFFFRLGY
jgi:dynein heavy chain, axonemal